MANARRLRIDPDERPMPGHSVAELHIPSAPSLWSAALEGLVAMNEQLMTMRRFPPLYSSGVIYKTEKREAFRTCREVLAHGWGDCDDLAGWRTAELHVSGEDPDAWADVYRTGPQRLHAIVVRGNGRIEDPSLKLGMPVRPDRRKKMPQHVSELLGNEDDGYDENPDDEGPPEGGEQEQEDDRAAASPVRKVKRRGRMRRLASKIFKRRRFGLFGEEATGLEGWQVGLAPSGNTPRVVLTLAQPAPGIHGAILKIPTENGKTIVMRTTPSKTPAEATMKAVNLAKLAAKTPELREAATPEARTALAHLVQPGAAEALTNVRKQEATSGQSLDGVYPRPPHRWRKRRGLFHQPRRW